MKGGGIKSKITLFLIASWSLLTASAAAFEPLFYTRIDYGAGDEPWSVFSADFDSDGDFDLAVANWFSDNVSILSNLSGPYGCDYISGDINSDGNVMGNDVTYGVRYFKGIGDAPPDSCPYEDGWLYAAGDVNGSCSFTGSDVTFLVAYFKGINPSILWCLQAPPAVPPVLGIHGDLTSIVLPKR
jgi:hypothetical protein